MPPKGRWGRFGISFAVVNIIKMIFIIELRLQERRRSPVIIWLCQWYSSICFDESLKIFTFWKKKKKGGGSYEFLLSTSIRRAQTCFTIQQIIGNSNKFCSRDPYFRYGKTSRNGIEPRQDLYLSMRKLSNLSRSVALWQSFPRCFLFGWPLFQP